MMKRESDRKDRKCLNHAHAQSPDRCEPAAQTESQLRLSWREPLSIMRACAIMTSLIMITHYLLKLPQADGCYFFWLLKYANLSIEV